MPGANLSDTRRLLILRAAAELFYTHSFAAVGIDAIGEQAGIAGPSIYRYFSGKDEILATLFDEALDGLVAATAATDDDPWVELGNLVSGHASFLLSQRKLAGVKIREERSLSGPSRRRLRAREQRYIARWTSCIARCLPRLDPDEQVTAAHAALGSVNSIAMWPPAAFKSADPAAVVERLIVDGLRSIAATHPHALPA